LLPSSVLAQQSQQPQTLKQKLVGNWTLVSCDNTGGVKFCSDIRGSQSFGGNGRYILMITKKDRPKVDGGREKATPEQYKAVAQDVVANFGTWKVEEDSKELSFTPEGALFPNAEGRERKATVVSLEGDDMKAKGPILGNSVWHRTR
jgi:hypothetical protein